MMKIYSLTLLVIINAGVNHAIPPSFRNGRIDYNSIDLSNNPNGPGSSEQQPSGPYPPSGWTPSGDLLLVPGETHSSQQDGYGPPPSPPPNNQYGPSSDPTTEQSTTTTQTQINQGAEEGELRGRIRDSSTELGQYYVLLPDGKLQKVQYSGKQKGRGQYEANVQYEEVDPIRSPVYSYQNFP